MKEKWLNVSALYIMTNYKVVKNEDTITQALEHQKLYTYFWCSSGDAFTIGPKASKVIHP